MRMGFDLDALAFLGQLSNIATQQLPFAASQALNDTAYEGLAAIKAQTAQVFDKPTRFTLNYFMVWRADKRTLEARIQPRPSAGRKHYLKVQESGGQRPATGVERLMSSRLAYEGLIAAVTPARGARLDSFGNWSSGERNQVLSALGAQRDATANTTAASAKRKRGRASYFVPRNGGLSPGVYRRTSPGAEPEKVLNFLDSMPSYAARFGFEDVIEDLWRTRLPVHLRRRLDAAIASAR